jgi:hypothetical protein
MSATFKCLISGNTVTFVHQVDIDSMKGHPDYVRVIEEVSAPTETPVAVVAPPKKMGRPSKAEQLAQLEVE